MGSGVEDGQSCIGHVGGGVPGKEQAGQSFERPRRCIVCWRRGDLNGSWGTTFRSRISLFAASSSFYDPWVMKAIGRRFPFGREEDGGRLYDACEKWVEVDLTNYPTSG